MQNQDTDASSTNDANPLQPLSDRKISLSDEEPATESVYQDQQRK